MESQSHCYSLICVGVGVGVGGDMRLNTSYSWSGSRPHISPAHTLEPVIHVVIPLGLFFAITEWAGGTTHL